MQVRVENLYYLLSYAAGRFDEGDLAHVGATDTLEAAELFARILVTATRALLRQRLDRGYTSETDDLRRPRGKIEFGRTAARGIAYRGMLECTFDETSEDVPHNRIIKATARRLATVREVPQALRHELAIIVREMPTVREVALSASEFQRVQVHSNLRRYRVALNVCALLFRCLLPEEAGDRWHFRSFSGDERELGLLFEDFVRAFLTSEQSIFLDVTCPKYKWQSEGVTHGLLPELRTDVCLRRPGKVVIIETKCYGNPLVQSNWGGSTLRPEHINQLMSYVTNYRTKEKEDVAGVLLYAVDRPRIEPSKFRVLGHEIHVREVNLDRPWREIAAGLQRLVEDLSSS